MKTKNGWLITLAGLTLAVVQPCAADPITNGFFFAQVHAPGVNNVTCIGADNPCTSTTAFGSVTAEAGGSLYPFAIADGSNNFGSFGNTTQGGAHEIYYFRINGADGSVPLNIAYSMNVSKADTNSNANAQLEVAGNILHTVSTIAAFNESFSDAPTLSFAANSIISVDLFAGGTNNFHAFVDPFITIDSQFLLQNPGYTLDFSSGIHNASPTEAGAPEPGTIVLTISALAGLVALKRKRG